MPGRANLRRNSYIKHGTWMGVLLACALMATACGASAPGEKPSQQTGPDAYGQSGQTAPVIATTVPPGQSSMPSPTRTTSGRGPTNTKHGGGSADTAYSGDPVKTATSGIAGTEQGGPKSKSHVGQASTTSPTSHGASTTSPTPHGSAKLPSQQVIQPYTTRLASLKQMYALQLQSLYNQARDDYHHHRGTKQQIADKYTPKAIAIENDAQDELNGTLFSLRAALLRHGYSTAPVTALRQQYYAQLHVLVAQLQR